MNKRQYLDLNSILKEYLPISKEQFYRYVRLEIIPKPIKVGRSSFWESNELIIAIEDLPNKTEKITKVN